MQEWTEDQRLLLDVLNSTPVVDGEQVDRLDGERLGGAGDAELAVVAKARDALQAVVRGQEPASVLAPFLRGVRLTPTIDSHIIWALEAPAHRSIAARLVIAWDELETSAPGRLRACANPDCCLFLLDRSKTGSGRWCSMAICGNRMKARRHYQRTHQAD